MDNKRTLAQITALLLLLLIIIATPILYMKLSYRMLYIKPSIDNVAITSLECYTNNRQTIKNDIDSLFNNFEYNLYYNNLSSNVLGKSSVLFRYITLDNNLDDISFAFTLTHELVHLTKFTWSERYCNYQSFIILYTSNNKWFRTVAKCWANVELNGGLSKEYSFVGHIEKYLKGEHYE